MSKSMDVVLAYLRIRNSDDIVYIDRECELLYEMLQRENILDTFIALMKVGPLEAGDIPSKSEKYVLTSLGMCTTVISKGTWAYAVPGVFDSFYSWYLKHHK